jgi:hypothetical protein
MLTGRHPPRDQDEVPHFDDGKKRHFSDINGNRIEFDIGVADKGGLIVAASAPLSTNDPMASLP